MATDSRRSYSLAASPGRSVTDHEHDWRKKVGDPSYRLSPTREYLTPVVCASCPTTAWANNGATNKEQLPPWRGEVVDVVDQETVRRHPSNVDWCAHLEPASIEIVHSQKNGYRAKAKDETGMTMGYCCSEGHRFWAQANQHMKETSAAQLVRIVEYETEAANV